MPKCNFTSDIEFPSLTRPKTLHQLECDVLTLEREIAEVKAMIGAAQQKLLTPGEKRDLEVCIQRVAEQQTQIDEYRETITALQAQCARSKSWFGW